MLPPFQAALPPCPNLPRRHLAPEQCDGTRAGGNCGRWCQGWLGCALCWFWVSTGLPIGPRCRLQGYYASIQLTTDRQIKGEDTCGFSNQIVTDGPRVFFSEPSSNVAQVSSSGGDVDTSTPFARFPFSDISPDKTELLGSSVASGNTSNRPLFSWSIANGQAHRLGNLSGHSAAWSPDGQRIAYAVNNSGTKTDDLYLAARDGSEAQKLIRIESGFVEIIRWSPDGKVLSLPCISAAYTTCAWTSCDLVEVIDVPKRRVAVPEDALVLVPYPVARGHVRVYHIELLPKRKAVKRQP